MNASVLSLEPRTNRFWLTVALAAIAVGLGIACVWSPRMVFAAGGFAALAICMIPLLRRERLDWLSPWTFLLLNVLLGCTLRGSFISFGLAPEEQIQSMFFRGHDPTTFFGPILIILTGLLCLVIGYGNPGTQTAEDTENPKPGPFVDQPEDDDATRSPLPAKPVFRFGVGVLCVSLLATHFFMVLTGAYFSGQLSAKRTLEGIPNGMYQRHKRLRFFTDLVIAGRDEAVRGTPEMMKHRRTDFLINCYLSRQTGLYRNFTSLRKLSELAFAAHLLVLAAAFCCRDSITDRRRLFLLALALLGAAFLLPFLSSSRAKFPTYLFGTLGIIWYYRRRVPWGRVALVGCAMIVVMQSMSLMRQASHRKPARTSVFNVAEPIVMNRNFLGISKTAMIIKAVPDPLPRANGETLFVWLLAPIPKAVWPDKPKLYVGKVVGDVVYDMFSGVPPGLIGELYWNFQLPGVLIGSLMFGWLMRILYERLAPFATRDPLRVLTYVIGPMQIGILAVGVTIGAGLFQIVLQMTIMTGMVVFVRWMARRDACEAVDKIPREPVETPRRMAA